jgi:hypothetical protein
MGGGGECRTIKTTGTLIVIETEANSGSLSTFERVSIPAGLVRDLKKNIFLPWLSLAVLFCPVKENISLLANLRPST